MMIDRRSLLATLPALAVCGAETRATAADERGVFWTVAGSGAPPSILYGYERTPAARVPDMVKDGERLAASTPRFVRDLDNVRFPPLDLSKAGLKPLMERLPPDVAQELRAAFVALGAKIDQVPSLGILLLLLSEGQTVPLNPTVGGTIRDAAVLDLKHPEAVLLTAADLKSLYAPPDVVAFDKAITAPVVHYLLQLRRTVGPIGRYNETLYADRQADTLQRIGAEMTRAGVPPLSALNGLPQERLQNLLALRLDAALGASPQQAGFFALPLGTLTGPDGLLTQVGARGYKVSIAA